MLLKANVKDHGPCPLTCCLDTAVKIGYLCAPGEVEQEYWRCVVPCIPFLSFDAATNCRPHLLEESDVNLDTDHIIHSRSGQLGSNVTSEADARRIALQAWDAGKTGKPIVLHFHGGLVSKGAAHKGATGLFPVYADRAGAYPIFSIWESGLIETVRNNLMDILSDSVFQELVKKVGEWVLKEGAPAAGAKGAGTAINETQYRRDFDEWFAGRQQQPPVLDTTPAAVTGAKAADFDEIDLAAKIEADLHKDPVFQQTMAGAAVQKGRASDAVTRGTGVAPRNVNTSISDEAADAMFGRPVGGTSKGAVSWVAVAKFVAKVAISVIKRLAKRRDHGAYTTIVEEILRAAYLAKVGAVVWGEMKKDCADAFTGVAGAGNAVLETWAQRLAAGDAPPRIVLVGHSTGAVYINHWIKQSAAKAPALKYDVIFLAPACLTEDFRSVAAEHGDKIANLRVFAMQDEREKDDVLVPIIYLRSLLYFVSGVVEAEVDAPVLGMQRFLQEKAFATGFPAVDYAKDYLQKGKSRAIWSIAEGDAGLASSAIKHGDFDDNEITRASMVSIISKGY